MNKKVILTGATGMTGGIILQHCLQSNEIQQVISLSRKKCNLAHPKLIEILHNDFGNYDNISSYFEGIDIAYFCIGAYTGVASNEMFKKITVDFAYAFSDVLKTNSPNATLCFLSGSGADQSEKSRIAFAKYKGMAENYLLSKNFEQLYIFRPGYIYPVEKRKEPNLTYSISRMLYPFIKLFGGNFSIKSTELAQSMFNVGLKGTQKTILENRDILALVN